MAGFLLRFAISALGLWLADQILPGLSFDTSGSLFAAALLLGIVNAFIRPLAVILTFPLTLLTLGLFLLVVNAAMLGLVAALLDGFHIAGFFSALFGWLIVSLTNWLAAGFIGGSGRIETLEITRS
jgi:putative membrane protein